MEPSAPNESSVPSTPAETIEATGGGARVPLILVGAAGALAGITIMLAFIWLHAEPPVQTAVSPATAPAPPPVVVESGPVPTWTGTRQARWARDGSRMIAFELQATHDVPVWMSRARPVLVVRCLYRTTEAFVAIGTSASLEETDSRTTRLQWDDDPVMVQQWEGSESGQELFAPNGVDFVRRLARVNRLRFGFTPFNAQPVTVEFAVQGFDQLAGLVAGTCGWRLDEPARSARLD